MPVVNRPTARLIAAILCDAAAHGADMGRAEDSALMAADMFARLPYGRARAWNAVCALAPGLADLLRWAQVDIAHVHAVEPRHVRIVSREWERARAWFEARGSGVPLLCVRLNTATVATWPAYGWKRAVWEVVNLFQLDSVDRATSGLPLPRDVREALVEPAH